MPRIVREVGVHLAEHVDRLGERLLNAVDIRAAEPFFPVRCSTLTRPGYSRRQRVGDRARAVGRLIVDHQDADVLMLHQTGDQHGQIRALVVGRDHDQRRPTHARGLSNLSDAICSDTSPMRNMTTLSRMSSTDEFVTCDCVAIVHTA